MSGLVSGLAGEVSGGRLQVSSSFAAAASGRIRGSNCSRRGRAGWGLAAGPMRRNGTRGNRPASVRNQVGHMDWILSVEEATAASHGRETQAGPAIRREHERADRASFSLDQGRPLRARRGHLRDGRAKVGRRACEQSEERAVTTPGALQGRRWRTGATGGGGGRPGRYEAGGDAWRQRLARGIRVQSGRGGRSPRTQQGVRGTRRPAPHSEHVPRTYPRACRGDSASGQSLGGGRW
jgi:hypothetical protein